MGEEAIKKLLKEIREEYQIPPYFSDDALTSYTKTAEHYLNSLVSKINYDTDFTARMLLKNYVFYAYHKKSDEFKINFNGDIVGWQMTYVKD